MVTQKTFRISEEKNVLIENDLKFSVELNGFLKQIELPISWCNHITTTSISELPPYIRTMDRVKK